jgi:HPt (histidine-containing phosphotransfer) domain-containing protein
MDTTEPLPMHDAPTLVARMMGDPEVCRGILESALLEIPGNAGAVETFRDGGPIEAAGRAFHSLRGSAAIFGAETFSSFLQRLEEDCEAGRRDDVLAALDTYSRELARYEEGLTNLARELEQMR